MTKEREALKLALEYIETNAHERRHVRWAIKEALAQLQQEPTTGNILMDSYNAMQSMKVEGSRHVVCQCDKCKAQPEQEPVAEAYALADKVRTELDKQSCPGVYMNIAWEAIVKNYRDLIYSAPPLPVQPMTGKGKEYSEQLKLCARNVAFVSAGWVNMSSAAMQEMFALIDHVCAGIDLPPQPEERNFCQRCGKPVNLTTIHTCTPPRENT